MIRGDVNVFRLVVLICILLILCACVSTPQIQSQFDPEQASFIHEKGPAVLSGQAFLRRKDGIVIYAAGSKVRLIPKTTHSKERMGAIYGDRKIVSILPQMPQTDPRYEEMMRETKADGEGRFQFDQLANGAYYVSTYVNWEVDGSVQGGSIMETVTIADGKSVQVIVSGE